ncbi:MAG: hypothetical protein GY810_01945, partial [Aureispira sp.]|nr:hypothetical protein [Aureispira sp.]
NNQRITYQNFKTKQYINHGDHLSWSPLEPYQVCIENHGQKYYSMYDSSGQKTAKVVYSPNNNKCPYQVTILDKTHPNKTKAYHCLNADSIKVSSRYYNYYKDGAYKSILEVDSNGQESFSPSANINPTFRFIPVTLNHLEAYPFFQKQFRADDPIEPRGQIRKNWTYYSSYTLEDKWNNNIPISRYSNLRLATTSTSKPVQYIHTITAQLYQNSFNGQLEINLSKYGTIESIKVQTTTNKEYFQQLVDRYYSPHKSSKYKIYPIANYKAIRNGKIYTQPIKQVVLNINSPSAYNLKLNLARSEANWQGCNGENQDCTGDSLNNYIQAKLDSSIYWPQDYVAYLSFSLDTFGKVDSIQFISKYQKKLDLHIKDIVSAMPPWQVPLMHQEVKIKATYFLSIRRENKAF